MTDQNENGRPDSDDDVYVIDGDEVTRESEAGSDEALTALRRENDDLRNQYLRKLADFDNFRKRTEREKTEYMRYALSGFIRELLPVLDNFERALAAAGDASSEVVKGVEMIQKQLLEVLGKAGITSVGEPGVPFDPAVHEAVMRVDDESVASNTVVNVMQKGYFLHDRLIRPAMVTVATGGPEPEQRQTEESTS